MTPNGVILAVPFWFLTLVSGVVYAAVFLYRRKRRDTRGFAVRMTAPAEQENELRGARDV